MPFQSHELQTKLYNNALQQLSMITSWPVSGATFILPRIKKQITPNITGPKSAKQECIKKLTRLKQMWVPWLQRSATSQ